MQYGRYKFLHYFYITLDDIKKFIAIYKKHPIMFNQSSDLVKRNTIYWFVSPADINERDITQRPFAFTGEIF